MREIIVTLVACILLVLPIRRPIWQKLRPIIAILALSIVIAPLIPGVEDRVSVRIEALGISDEAAQGTEIRIKSVSFDGVPQDLNTLFPGNSWRIMANKLTWRSFDAGNEPVIYDQWPVASEYEIVFEKSKWRGMAEVQLGHETYLVDCYSEANYGEEVVLNLPGPEKTTFMEKAVSYAIFAAILMLICLLLPLLSRMPQKDSRDPGAITRESWSDILRLLAILAIVLVESTGRAFEVLGMTLPSPWGHLLLYAVESFGFPVFLMLTGSFLLYRDEDPADTVTKRLPSVLVPVIGLIMLTFLSSGYFELSGTEKPPVLYVLNSLFGAYDATPSFLLILVALYLLTPVLRPIFLHSNTKTRGYAVGLLYLLPSLVYTVLLMLGQSGALLTCAMYLSYLGQFLFGAYLVAHQEKLAGKWIRYALVSLLGYGLTVAVRYYTVQAGNNALMTPLAAGIDSVLFASGIFALFMALAPAFTKLPERLRGSITRTASLAVGILMVHTILMRRMPTITIGDFVLQMNSSTLWISVAMGAAHLVISIAISYVISTVPVLKRVIGLDWYSANKRAG